MKLCPLIHVSALLWLLAARTASGMEYYVASPTSTPIQAPGVPETGGG
ncbi:MAG: hypothetical protein M3O46_21750 [Myxococcota bacterium]|nr:hypothetical protein [Myxococcota bacterium]